MRKFKTIAALMTGAVFPLAFNNGGWKMDGDKLAMDAKGNPIFINSDGAELATEANTISRLNAEAKGHRERAEAAETRLAAFKDIDPDKAREAFDKLSKVDQKKLIDAGEVDKVRNEVSANFTAQIAEKDKAISSANDRINGMIKDRAFDRSKFIAENIAIPADMFTDTFGKHFKVDEKGNLVANDKNGNPIYSKTRMSEIADVDEALSILVDQYPHKDRILKAPDVGGSGNGGGGGNRGTGRTMRRAEFDGLDPVAKANTAAAVGKGEMQLVD